MIQTQCLSLSLHFLPSRLSSAVLFGPSAFSGLSYYSLTSAEVMIRCISCTKKQNTPYCTVGHQHSPSLVCRNKQSTYENLYLSFFTFIINNFSIPVPFQTVELRLFDCQENPVLFTIWIRTVYVE